MSDAAQTETTTTTTTETPAVTTETAKTETTTEVKSLLGATPETETKTEAKTEGATEKKDDAQPYAPEVPKELEDFADKGMLEKFAALANEKKLAPDVANAIVKMSLENAAEQRKSQDKHVADVQSQWLDQVKADKELGGAKLPETVADIGRAFAAAGPVGKAAQKVLEESGLTNNPDLVRFVKFFGEKLREDTGQIPGAGGTTVRKSDWLDYGQA